MTMSLICCVTENKGPGAAEHEPRCGFSGVVTSREQQRLRISAAFHSLFAFSSGKYSLIDCGVSGAKSFVPSADPSVAVPSERLERSRCLSSHL